MSQKQEKLNQQFREAYGRLNEQQRAAVDKLEGPVIVVAGPGTGKTQILSARIGKILSETDAAPENILCLTYTDAGTIAMRRRLLGFIGPDAYKVNIYTFHAFCNEIIQENLPLFEKNTLDPISDLERIRLFKQLIDSFPKNHPLKRYRGDVYYEISNLQQLFSTMKKEGWTPEFINIKIDEYLADLPHREIYIAKKASGAFKKGDLRTDKVAEETERMEKLRAAVHEFDRFQQLMRDNNLYDFDDMINWVIGAFENNRELLLAYQERYQYILVDEYQDTSGTQNRLVELLVSFWDQPNIFVVGDDDQSIYRFQGANIENMKAFTDNYQKDLLTVVLTRNYRSTQPILDISRTLIEKNSERLIHHMPGLTKELIASHPRMQLHDGRPVIREYESQRMEMTDIILRVENLVQGGVLPGSIAVIYKENRYGEELAKFFQLRKVPFYSKRSVNLFEVPLARKILLILRFLAAEHDAPYGGDEMLFEILHFDFFHIAPIEIARLSVEVASRQFGENRTSIRSLLAEKTARPPKDLFDTGLPESLKKAGQYLEGLIQDVSNVTLQQLFENIISGGGVLQHVMESPEKIWLLEVLTALFDFIKNETRRNSSLDTASLMAVVDMMEDNEIPIPLVRVAGNDKGVNLLTTHGSKGLEFEYVFFAGCNAGFWEKKRKPAGGYKFPDTMFKAPSRGGEEEELRRLFFVALTRAQTELFISYAQFKDDGKEMEPSMFIAEILDSHSLVVEKVTLDAATVMEFEVLQFSKSLAPEIEKAEEDFIGRILEKFVMNVTALNNYLKCPLEFYYKNLIRIPSPKNEATEFGSAVHYALQKLFEKMQADPRQAFPPREDMLADFNWYMHRHRESFIQEAFDRRMEYGLEVLSNYYDKYLGSWNRIVAVERNIRNVLVEQVPLKGKLDKLEFSGREVNVVDYKTGDIDKALPKLKGPSDKNPLGGDYWRQAVFYKILVDHYGAKDWTVTSTEFDFVEPDKKKEYRKVRISISPADTATVIQQITRSWEKIQQRDFYTGCGDKDCHWCNFVKDNQLAVALHELDEPEEAEAADI